MPAKSDNQRITAAIALNAPQKLYKRNRGMRAMSDKQLGEFAATKRKGLPKKKGPKPHWSDGIK